jgi:hypothetical protein
VSTGEDNPCQVDEDRSVAAADDRGELSGPHPTMVGDAMDEHDRIAVSDQLVVQAKRARLERGHDGGYAQAPPGLGAGYAKTASSQSARRSADAD